ncbi:MAG: OmpA family protein [Bacteroidota bacterium]
MQKTLVLLLITAFFSFSLFAQDDKPLEYEDYMTLRGHDPGGVQNIRFSPDGKMLATAGLDKKITLWDLATGKPITRLFGHGDEIYEATFSGDGKLLVSASADMTARVWDVRTGRWKGTYSCKEAPGSESGVRLRKTISFADFTNDQKFIIYGGNSGYLMKADISSPSNRATVLYNANNPDGTWYSTITGGVITPNGKEVIISVGTRLDFVDIKTGKRTRFVDIDDPKYAGVVVNGFNDVVIGPDKKSMAAWSFDGKVSIWDLKTLKLKQVIPVTMPRNYSGATFSRDQKLMATGANGSIAKVWDWEKGKDLATLVGHTNLIRICRFSPSEDILATASYDGTVKLWREKEPEEKPEVPETPETPETPDPPVVEEKDPPVTIEETEETPPVEEETVTTTEPELPEPSFDETDLEVGRTINLKNIQFKRGTSELLPDSYSDLGSLLATLERHPDMEIELRGHTDNVGKQSINLRLSGDRVRVVREYLLKAGIARNRITTRAFGGIEPIADNSREETRKLNRRVEVRIKKL